MNFNAFSPFAVDKVLFGYNQKKENLLRNSLYTFQTKVLNRSAIVKWMRSHVMYPALTRLVKNRKIVFLNYGYASLDPTAPKIDLQAADETNRFCIQLYQRVVSAVDLRGSNLLEVSCGHGGGADYIMRYLHPATLTGIDLNLQAIQFCRENNTLSGLAFVHGSAEALEFKNESFDAVINVEASHCYGSMERFLQEVKRVLRPGGYFLFADIRRQEDIALLNDQLARSGLEVLSTEDITASVIQAIELDDARKKEWVQSLAPRGFRSFFEGFARLKETPSYQALASGEERYLCYVLRK